MESREPVSAGTRSRKLVTLTLPDCSIAAALNEVIGFGAAYWLRAMREPVTTISAACASAGTAASALAGGGGAASGDGVACPVGAGAAAGAGAVCAAAASGSARAAPASRCLRSNVFPFYSGIVPV